MTVSVGFLGCGFIADFHAAMLAGAATPNRIVSVHDVDTERARSFADRHGGEVAGDAPEVVADSDVVFVCTWTSAHLDGVRDAVAAGVPVFCEKPLSTDLASARQLVAVVQEAGVLNQVGLVLRSSPALLAVRELLTCDSVGRVISVVFRDDQYLPIQGIYDSTWRADPDRAGSGTLLEHSIHDVDVLEWLFGEVVSVSARTRHVHDLAGIEDCVSALVQFDSGASATLTSVWHDVLSRPSQRRIEVFCERALLTVEGEFFGPVRLQTSEEERVWEGESLLELLAGRGVTIDIAENQLLSAIAAGERGQSARCRPDVHDALRAHELVDAIYRSARRGGEPVTSRPTTP